MSTLDHHYWLKDVIFEIGHAGKGIQAPSWVDGSTPLARHTLLYLAQGAGRLTVNGQSCGFERDALFIYPPGKTMSVELATEPDSELYVVSFDWFRLAEQTDAGRSYMRELSFPLEGRLQLSGSLFKRYLYLLAAGEDQGRSPLLAQQHLSDLLQILLQHARPAAANELSDRLRSTLDYMQNHYREEIRVDKLAELARLHPSYYSQIFKKAMDKTPVSYLTHLRMNKAKEMLLTTNKPVNDIAADVGYVDEFYFSRRFKDTNGYSPTIYTKKQDLNIISLSSPYTDHLFTLGIVPCAAQVHRYMPLVTKALTLPKHESEPWETSRQAFSDMQPDLIVCKDNVLAKAKAHINDIAPIVPIPWASKDIYTHHCEIAELVDRRQESLQWVDAHNQKADRIRKKVKASVGEASAAICVVRKNDLRMYGTRNIGHVFYRSLGMAMPDRIANVQAMHRIGTGFNWISIKPDEITDFESDYMFLVCETMLDYQRVLHLLETNSNWKNHPAVRAQKLRFLEWEKWIVYAPHGIDQQLEEAERLLIV
ncbi:AraC-like DNA-binding protein [Paenibacillus endophyticus]|uniref:AraC-like DNA-binding protein n=1 Tax=Paenibacillus endophyticus TaxID=1294268 RepID=A0A7W5GAV2_9BACL|nr:helix-turn-helix domain-containing protein [Paenibacillus endophyticus]MBB3153115.1 AraC-like DNA-binding protein [Paenibacillus endophyticus]